MWHQIHLSNLYHKSPNSGEHQYKSRTFVKWLTVWQGSVRAAPERRVCKANACKPTVCRASCRATVCKATVSKATACKAIVCQVADRLMCVKRLIRAKWLTVGRGRVRAAPERRTHRGRHQPRCKHASKDLGVDEGRIADQDRGLRGLRPRQQQLRELQLDQTAIFSCLI